MLTYADVWCTGVDSWGSVGVPASSLKLYMCPHTAIYRSSYCYICVLIPTGADSWGSMVLVYEALNLSYECMLTYADVC